MSTSAEPTMREDAASAIADVDRIATEVSALWADDVDRDARFPHESASALKAAGALSVLVPARLGGAGLRVSDAAEMVRRLARNCASSALVMAMHQIQVACMARHATSPALEDYLRRIAAEQILLGNANSEIGIGGDARSSGCAVERSGDDFRLEKNALAISYGAYADGILATARRDADSSANDQVLVLCAKPDYTLEQTGSWNTVGLRGTCSNSFKLTATGPADFVMPDWATISGRTGLPVGNLLLSSVWLGIAEDAARRAHASVRKQARKQIGQVSPSAIRLAELSVQLQQLRDTLSAAAADYEAAKDTDDIESVGFATRAANVKVAASTLVVDVVQRATIICGIEGYRQDSAGSLGRSFRDAQGAPLMVNNDRVLLGNAQRLIAMKEI